MIAPGEPPAYEVKLNQLKVVDEGTRQAHNPPIQARVVFVRRPTDHVEWEPIKISSEIQTVGLYPTIAQSLKRSDQSLE